MQKKHNVLKHGVFWEADSSSISEEIPLIWYLKIRYRVRKSPSIFPILRQTNTVRASLLYRVIHKSLRDFRTRLRNNQDRHGRKKHINR